MLSVIRRSLAFLSLREKWVYFSLVISKCLLTLLDLLGIAAIGYLATSIAMFLTSGSDPERYIKIFGLEIPAANLGSLPALLGIVLSLFVFKAVFAILITRRLAIVIAMIEARGAKQIAQNLLGSDLQTARRHSREEVIFAIQNGSPAAFNSTLNNLATVSSEGFLFIGLISTFFFINAGAAIGFIVFFGVIAVAMHRLVGARSQAASAELSQSIVATNTVVGDLISGYREIFVLGKRQVYFDKIFEGKKSSALSVGRQIYLAGMPRYVVETSLLVGLCLFGLSQSASGDLVSLATTTGIFLTGGLRLMAAMLPLQNAAISIKETIVPASKALEALNLPKVEELDQTSDGEQTTGFPLGLELRDVRFKHIDSSSEAIRGVSAVIEKGTQVAIIGRSGAGKSTLADLVCGLLEPTSGEVIIDGLAAHQWVRSKNSRIAYVPQHPGSMSGTIAENIAVGVDEERIDSSLLARAIELANLAEWIGGLPLGTGTDLGASGESVSGGQLQRIGLARALYGNPGLLVIDEGTSSLDAETESGIGISLDRLRGAVTVVLVAHRLNTVKGADQVLLLSEGKIRDRGTFQDLLERVPEIARAARFLSA